MLAVLSPNCPVLRNSRYLSEPQRLSSSLYPTAITLRRKLCSYSRFRTTKHNVPLNSPSGPSHFGIHVAMIDGYCCKQDLPAWSSAMCLRSIEFVSDSLCNVHRSSRFAYRAEMTRAALPDQRGKRRLGKDYHLNRRERLEVPLNIIRNGTEERSLTSYRKQLFP